MRKYPQNTRQDKSSRKRVPRDLRSFDSLSLSSETINDNSTDDIMSMVMQEKAAALDPEKRASMDGCQVFSVPTKSDLESDATPVRQGRRLSTPGAFRFGTDDDGARSIAGDSEGSASCIIMIPRASLVDNEIEEKDKDLEAPTSTVAPMVYAEKSTESLKSAPPQKKSRKRAFRLCMILLCLLVAGLLGGVLYFLLKDDSSSALESSTTDDSNLFERPPPRNDDEGGGRGDGKPPRDD
jgi:hypothetical protein